MNKKTLENYKQEFDNIARPKNHSEDWLLENLYKYEQLSKECIADYPDQELGYIELGNFIAEFA